MNHIRGLFEIFILWQCWLQSQASTTYDSRLTNRRQKKLIESSMNLKAKPCDNFYNYACGNWDTIYEGANKNFIETVTMLDYNVNMEMHRYLDRSTIRNKPKFEIELRKYYNSCKNLSKYEAVNYLLWLKLNDQFQWPAIWTRPKKNKQFDWVKTLAKMRTYGFNDVFIQQIFIQKMDDATVFLIDLDKPVKDLGFKALTKENLDIIMQSLPAAIETNNLNKLWQEIKEFEELLTEIDEISDISVEDFDAFEMERVIKFKDLPLDWLKDYLRIILNQTTISPDMELYIQNKPYMIALDNLLKRYTSRFITRYLEIRFLWYLHVRGPTNFLEVDCLSSIRSLMPTAMHWLYEQQNPDLVKEYDTIYEMFSNLRKFFGKTIQKNIHGFNSTIVQHLQTKLDHMKLKLNNIPRVDTIATLEKFYKDLDLNALDFYGNFLKLLRFDFKTHLDLLDKNKRILGSTYLEEADTGPSSSPFFIQSVNTVFIPLTLLQQPVYHGHLDDVYKYSSLGFLIAHEMFHGFDDTGLLTNANGTISLINYDENAVFNASLNCLMEINPTVISEKIADISGLRYAYQAYFDTYPDAVNQTIRLYGKVMPMTQVFFLNFAQFFCGNLTSNQMEAIVDHGADRERVMDALGHFPEFAKAYQCSRNDRLYLQETCHLWRR